MAAWDPNGFSPWWNPYANMPTAPSYTPIWNPEQAIAPGVQGQLGQINLNTAPMEQYTKESMRTGPSEWANRATKQSFAEQKAQEDQASQMAGNAGAAAQAQLGMGGTTSGAGERAAEMANRDRMASTQQGARAGASARGNISMQDESNRMSMLGAAPSMQVQALQPQFEKVRMGEQAQQFDVGNQTTNQIASNAFQSQQYADQMKAWAAGKQANATQSSGKK